MTINDKIRYEKLQYDINREVAKISAPSSRKIDQYYYLTGEHILQVYLFSFRKILRETNKNY